MHRTGGFTLIEMLVVLLVMGLLVGLVTVTTRPDERGLLRVEAERLTQLLNLAAQESRLGGKPIRWDSDGIHYRFWRLNANGEWREIRDNDLLRARSLPLGMAITSLRVAAARPQTLMQLEFIPYGPPLVFSIEMSLGTERSRLMSSPLGEVRLLPYREQSNAG